MMYVGMGDLEMSVARDKIVFTLSEQTGYIRSAELRTEP